MSKLGRYSADRKKIEELTADKTVEVADCCTIFTVDPAATTTITMPSASDAVKGWWCKIIVHESAAASDGDMAQVVNVSFSGQVVLGHIASVADAAGDTAVSGDDFFNFTANATGGDMIEAICDGTRWYVHGIAAACGGDVRFHTAAE